MKTAVQIACLTVMLAALFHINGMNAELFASQAPMSENFYRDITMTFIITGVAWFTFQLTKPIRQKLSDWARS